MSNQNIRKDIKLVALDMDGTLLNSDHEVSEANRKAIEEAQKNGVHVVLSTGRTLMTCRDYAKSLKLSSYLVTVNGSEIWHSTGELIERNLLQAELIKMMVDLRDKYDTKCWAASVNEVWRAGLPNDIENYEWMKFGFEIEDDDVRETIINILSENKNLEISNSSPTNLEINAIGINKANALKKVCEHVDISMDQVISMGDSLNDLAMIKEAGLGIAVGNAQDVVKEAADWVTATNNEDGVAKAIHRFLL